MAKKHWRISNHSTIDKSFFVYGPHGFELEIDYDDVNHREVDVMVEAVVETLNEHFPTAKVGARLKSLNYETDDE